ncbi:MAG: cysteine synthase A [Gammaproteobacteria bacterium]|nr:MAG: cysteine synthase A [Gammaproteobacteria bacterium]
MVGNAPVVELIGNTPLIKLRGVSDMTGCTILAKCEFMNPGGSVKDRTALGILQAAIDSGELKPGGTIVEGTAGNTGIGLTLLSNALGYKSEVVMPISQSKEKIDTLELLGAKLHLVPATSYTDENHYIHTAKRLAERLNQDSPGSAVWAAQFDNLANMRAHYLGTGQEIWQQTRGDIDGFVCSVGTGGTLAGTSTALKEHKADVCIALADPRGASLYNYINTGELKKSEGSSVIEGIGINHITGNIQQAKVDKAYSIDDAEALPLIFSLLRDEGICVGGSSAINIAGAVRLARDLGRGATIVTILCDDGMRYQSKIYNPAYLQPKGLPIPPWLAI